MGKPMLERHNAFIQPIKIDLNKKLDPKQKTIQTFNIDAKRFRKTKIISVEGNRI